MRTSDLAKAAGVTWPAAKRWREDVEPRGKNLLAIAKVLKMSPEEFKTLLDSTAPAWPSWTEFLETPAGRELSEVDRMRVARAARMLIEGAEQPSVSTLVLIAQSLKTLG